MAVSKRTRFEVLRRDNHTCQYCGAVAPDVTLHVDHVIPVTLGGSDDPSNLVAACKDCNLGKTSVTLESPLVAAIGQRSAEWALANLNRKAFMKAELAAISAFEDAFITKWEGFTYRKGIKDLKVPLPADWRTTLKAWWRISVPEVLIESAVDTAMAAPTVEHENRFRYFCGVVWRHLDEFDMRYPAQTNMGRVYTEDELNEARFESFREGMEFEQSSTAEYDFLTHFIDGTTSWPIEHLMKVR